MAWNQQYIDQWYQQNLAAGVSKSKLDAMVQQKQSQYFTQQGIAPGQIETDPLKRSVQMQQLQAGTYKQELSETEIKNQEAKTKATQLVTELEDAYFGGKDFAAGRVGGIMKWLGVKTGGIVGQEEPELAAYKAKRQSIRPTLAKALGDVGNLSKSEQEAAVKTIPTEFSTPKEAIAFFKAMRETFGLESRDVTGQAESLGKGQAQLAVEASYPGLSQMYEEAKQDVASGPRGRIKVYAKTAFPVLNLLDQSGRKAAGEVLSTLFLFDILKGGVWLLRGGGPRKQLYKSAKATADKLTGKVPEKVYTDAGKKALSKATPDELPYIQKMVERAKDMYKGGRDHGKAFDDIFKAGKKSFTKASDVKTGAAASYNRELWNALKGYFQQASPTITKQITQMKHLRKGSGILKKLLWPAAMGVSSYLGGREARRATGGA